MARLPRYLRALIAAENAGDETISSDDLAQGSGVNSANVRKDLSYLGTFGTRGVGYQVDDLISEISAVLGITTDRPVVIVGIGNLGRALATYGGFEQRGFTIAGLVDADPAKIGVAVGDHAVESFDDLRKIVEERSISIAVVATPAAAAQAVAGELVDAGVTAILNFAPVHVDVPEHVSLRHVDLSTELQILSFYEQLGSQPPVERDV